MTPGTYLLLPFDLSLSKGYNCNSNELYLWNYWFELLVVSVLIPEFLIFEIQIINSNSLSFFKAKLLLHCKSTAAKPSLRSFISVNFSLNKSNFFAWNSPWEANFKCENFWDTCVCVYVYCGEVNLISNNFTKYITYTVFLSFISSVFNYKSLFVRCIHQTCNGKRRERKNMK